MHKGVLDHGRFSVPYRCYGEHGPVLLCVSGALQTMAVWRAVARRFAARLTVVVFDTPGVGRGEIRSGDAHVSVEEQLGVVDALIDACAPAGPLTLAGSSWGSAIATTYAATRPERVDQLVLSSFGMKPNAELARVVGRAEGLYRARDYAGGADLLLEMIGQRIGDAYKRQIVAQFASLTDESASAFYEHCRNVLQLGSLEARVDLSRIRARTLIVNGAEDRIIDLDDMYTAQALIPDCECRLVPDVGHFLHFERPELLDDYEDFILAGVSPQGAAGAGGEVRNSTSAER